MSRTVRVRCICPDPTTHAEGDEITLPDKLDFRQLSVCVKSVRILKATSPNADVAEILALLQEVYLLHCLEAWTLVEVDAKGKRKPIEPERDAITAYLLSQPDVAIEVADVADELYSEAVLVPLVGRASNSSPTSPTESSTSQPTSDGPTPMRKPSKRSSTSTSRTGATALTA
jgi:hypothetical protein